MITHPVDLIIFDCDGVLIDSEVISTRATVRALADVGYVVSETEAFRRYVGKSYASIRRDVEGDWGQRLPVSFDDDLESMTLDIMADELLPIAGVASALSMLEPKRCVASSSSLAWIRQGLTSTGLLQQFDPHLFSASMVKNGKPAPDLFLHATRKMAVPATRALVIEDSLPGVQAGVAAGMTVIGFTGGSHIVDPDHGAQLRRAGASVIIDDMTALPGLLGEAS